MGVWAFGRDGTQPASKGKPTPRIIRQAYRRRCFRIVCTAHPQGVLESAFLGLADGSFLLSIRCLPLQARKIITITNPARLLVIPVLFGWIVTNEVGPDGAALPVALRPLPPPDGSGSALGNNHTLTHRNTGCLRQNNRAFLENAVRPNRPARGDCPGSIHDKMRQENGFGICGQNFSSLQPPIL